MKTTLQLLFLFASLTSLGQSVGVRISTNTALTQGDQVIWSGSAWVTYGKGTNGQVLTMDGTNVVWATPFGGGDGGGSGTVTSVGASTTVSGLGFSGSPVTTSGTLSLTGTVAVASGGTGATDASTARSNLGVLSSRWLTGFGSPSDYSEGIGTYYVNLETYQVWEQTGVSTFETIPFFVMGEGVYSYLDQPNTFANTNTFLGAVTLLGGISGNGTLLTNLNGTEIRSGTVAAARIDSAIARLTSPSFIGTLTNTGSIGSPDLIAGSSLTLGSTTRTNLNSPDMEEFESVVVNFIRGNALTMTAIGWPTFSGAAISSGTITTTTDEAGHIGIANISSASGANSGLYLLSTSESFAQVGMTWESISKSINTNAGSMASYGFTDVATLGNPTDGIRLYRSNNFVLGQVFNNTVLTQTAQAPILSNQWISVKIQITDTNSVAFDVWDFNTSTSILSETLTALPGPSRTFGFGIIAGYTNAAATVIESVDKVRFSVY